MVARWVSILTGALALLAGIAYVSRPPDYTNPNLVVVDAFRPYLTPQGLGLGFLLAGILIIAGWALRSEVTRQIGHTLGAIVYTMYGVALVMGALIAGGPWAAGTLFLGIGILHITLSRKTATR